MVVPVDEIIRIPDQPRDKADIIITIMRRVMGLKLLLPVAAITLFLLGFAPAGASSANISHSYRSSQSIPNGSLVSLDPQKSDYVQLANTDNGIRLLGIAVNRDDSLLAVDSQDGNLQIATSGNASVLVSTLNGDIKVGDQVAVSPFGGVGMKAQIGSRVIGLAQTGFDEHSEGVKKQTVTDKAGKRSSVSVGFTSVSIAVGNSGPNAANLTALQRIARSLTGKVVSTQRIILSLVVAIITMIALLTLIYASIYGSIISIGRNPLAKYAVFRTLSSVMGLALLVAAIAVVVIFFLLR